MKRLNKLLGIIALLAVLGFLMAACDLDEGGGNPFVRTWNGVDTDGDAIRIVFTDSTWTSSYPGYPEWGTESGTYTRDGKTATLYSGFLSSAYGNSLGTATVSGGTLTVTRTVGGTIYLY